MQKLNNVKQLQNTPQRLMGYFCIILNVLPKNVKTQKKKSFNVVLQLKKIFHKEHKLKTQKKVCGLSA